MSVAGSSERIVITGAGLVTPLGISRQETWSAVLQGRCGIGPMGAMESSVPDGTDGGQAPALPPDFAPHLPREARYLRYTIRQALADAGAAERLPYPPDRCGIILGTTLHGMRGAGEFLRTCDCSKLRDFPAGAVMDSAAGDLHLAGCAATTCSACSSSLGSIALAATLLRSGQLDFVLAGGYDTISEYVYGGFNSLRLVAPGPLRPFASDRQGMKLAEGYGIVVLERADDASGRGASALATLLGYGESADAHHLTQPHPEGEGAARAMRAALASAGLEPSEIGLIAAHATGTPDNDAAEFTALSRAFGPALSHVPVIAFKSHLGHTLGGAGAVELILSMMALRDQVVPPCANVSADEVEFPELQLSVGGPNATPLRATLNLSLGFGGANTCVILSEPAHTEPAPMKAEPRRYSEHRLPSHSTRQRDVFITGIGVVFPGAVGVEAFARRWARPAPLTADAGAVGEADIAPMLSARRVRRMSEYVKLSLAAAVLCLRDAGVEDVTAFCEPCAAIVGTSHGSANYCHGYYRQIVNEGIAAANPMLFAEGVPNAAAAHLSLMLSLKGPCQTVIGSRTAGLDAMRLAGARIASGEWERAIVGAAEEYSQVVNTAYGHWGLYGPGGFFAGAGAVTFLLESRSSLESRRGRARGRLICAAGGSARGARAVRLVRDLVDQLGPASTVLCSANGTWIDRVESAALGLRQDEPHRVYGCVAECFSALPLAGIAGALLAPDQPGVAPAADPCIALATDYAGFVSAVAIARC